MLHGGAARGEGAAVRRAQLSVLRTVPLARRIARVGAGRLAVFRLLNSTRGWDQRDTPVRDAQWALEEIGARFTAPVAVCVVGHSLGGRAAILTASTPGVRAVVALAPWVYPTDVPARLSGVPILIIHGDHDRIASPQRSAELARELSRHTPVSYITVEGGTHALLGRRALCDALAGEFALAELLGVLPGEGPIARIEAGERCIRI